MTEGERGEREQRCGRDNNQRRRSHPRTPVQNFNLPTSNLHPMPRSPPGHAPLLTGYHRSPAAQAALSARVTGKYKPGEEHPSDSRATSDAMGWAMDHSQQPPSSGTLQLAGSSGFAVGRTLPLRSKHASVRSDS